MLNGHLQSSDSLRGVQSEVELIEALFLSIVQKMVDAGDC